MRGKERLSSTMRIDIPPHLLDQMGQSVRISPAGKGKGLEARASEPGTAMPVGDADFQELLQSVYDGAVITDGDGVILDVNERAVRLFGYEREVLDRACMIDLISGAEPSLLDNIRTALAGDRFILIEACVIREDGSLVPVEISVNRLNLSTQAYLCFFIRDVTLRKDAEKQLRTENNAIQNASTGIATTGLDLEIEFANPALLGLLCVPRAEALFGRRLDDFICDPAIVQAIAEHVGAGRTWFGECEIRRADDGRFFGQISAAPNVGDEDEPIGMVFSILDVTERRMVEERIREVMGELARSNADLEQFAYVVSHDLQEPLRKVTAFGDLLTAKCGDGLSDQGREYVDRMQNAARRMQELIRDLLAFSRISTRAKPCTAVNLNDTVSGVLNDLETRIQQSRAQVSVEPLPVIEAEAIQMRQLMQNLVGNALKFHKPGVPPTVHIGAVTCEQGACCFVVEDNGIGFDPLDTERIFGVFQRLHTRQEYEGTGIGLAVCRKIVERHGGTITAKPTPGEGARFIVTLPLRQPEASPS